MSSEIVAVALERNNRLKLYGQLTAQMEQLGYNAVDFAALDLGFDLAEGWPLDIHAQPTLAQLTMVAFKLKMKIEIADLNLAPTDV